MFSYKIDFLLHIAAALLCIVILNVFFSGFFQQRKKFINIVVYFIYMVWQMFLFTMSQFPSYINLAIGLLLNGLVALICFKGKSLQKIAFSGILSILWTYSEFFVGHFFVELGIDYRYPHALGALISEIFTLIIIFCLNRYFQIDNIKNLPVKHYVMLMFFPIGSLFIVYKIFMYGSILKQGQAIKETAVCLLIMLFINLLVFKLYLLLANELVLRRYNAVYTQQLEIYSKNMKEKETSLTEFRKAKHDMKQHYISLLSMMEQQHYEMAESYLSNLVEESQSNNYNISRTENLVVDAIVNAKYSLMQALEIDCQVNIHIPTKLPFEMADLSVLLGNVIDNAIEANGDNVVNKYVKIYMVYDKNILIIIVINSYDGKLEKDKAGKIVTRKKDRHTHGFGLNSIENIVKKYHGSIVIENNSEEFKIKLILIDDKQKLLTTS